MKKTVYYWSPCLTHVGTIKSTLNSSIALAKYNSNYEVILLNVFGEWTEYKKCLNEICIYMMEFPRFVGPGPDIFFKKSGPGTCRFADMSNVTLFSLKKP